MITQQHLDKSISFEEYYKIAEQHAIEGKTSGENQSEELIEYSKLNFSRLKRSYKTTVPSEDVLKTVDCLNEKMIWIVLTETWCGDAAQNIAVLAKIAESNPAISFRLLFRDENLDVIDNYLTNGGRAIPKLICLDQELNEIGTWGPRPAFIQNWFNEEKVKPEANMDELKLEIQKKYNEDKGQTLQKEMVQLMKDWLKKECFSL
ncbi:MAG: thioredoxin family protein [Flavobacteriales bacterium]|nr:thioredoxin family protein [Flavobacteriales bacterium]